MPAMMVRLKNTVRIQVLQEAARSVKENFRREFVVMDILKGVFKIAASSVFCLQDFTTVGFMDLTFFNLTDCVSFFESWERKKHKLLEGLRLLPLFAQDYLPLTIHLYNPFVEDGEVVTFLERHCEAVKGGERVRDRFGIWTGKRRFFVKLRVDPSISGCLVHIPGSFSIGPNRGFLYYPGQPTFCRRCGGEGHVKADCEGQRCRFCGAADHFASACPAPKLCSLCGKPDHLYRACPSRVKSYASVLKEGEDLQADLEAILSSLPVEGEEQLGRTTGANDQERKSASGVKCVGVKDQVDGGVGELISLSLDGKVEKKAGLEQQLNPPSGWSELDFTEVLSDVLEGEEGQAVLEPTIGATHQRERVQSGSKMEIASELEPGMSRRRAWSEAGDRDNEAIRKYSKFETVESLNSVGQGGKGEGYEDKEKEVG
ncbi:MAG: hypothetical protein ACRC4N_04345, partial [Gammaproteobacteria bacterium]